MIHTDILLNIDDSRVVEKGNDPLRTYQPKLDVKSCISQPSGMIKLLIRKSLLFPHMPNSLCRVIVDFNASLAL